MAEPMNDPVTGMMAGQQADAATGGASGLGDTNGMGNDTSMRVDTTDNMADTVSGASADSTEGMTMDTSKIAEHMDVVGSDGDHIGTVDHINGDQIKLTKNDAEAGGVHHLIPVSMVDMVDDKVRLNVPGRIAQEQWQPA